MLTLSILKMYFTLVGPVILLSSMASHLAYQDGKFVLFTRCKCVRFFYLYIHIDFFAVEPC